MIPMTTTTTLSLAGSAERMSIDNFESPAKRLCSYTSLRHDCANGPSDPEANKDKTLPDDYERASKSCDVYLNVLDYSRWLFIENLFECELLLLSLRGHLELVERSIHFEFHFYVLLIRIWSSGSSSSSSFSSVSTKKRNLFTHKSSVMIYFRIENINIKYN